MGQKTVRGIRVTYESTTDNATQRIIKVTGASSTGTTEATSSSRLGIYFYIGSNIMASTTAGSMSDSYVKAAKVEFIDDLLNRKPSATITKTHSDQTIHIGLHVLGQEVYTTHTISAKTSYTVTYNANGGSGAPAASTKWHGETLTLSTSKPTRTGYTFKGWGESSTATSTVTTYTGNAAKTFYAVWQINTYTVSYANGGRGTAPASQTKTYGTNLALRAGLGVVSNYRFSKWKATDGTLYAGGGTYSKNVATTMTAQWIAPYTVSYNGNGSTGGSTSAQTKVHDTALALQSNGFTRTNHAFAGWNTKSDGSGTAYSAGQSYTANAAVTLYAQWTQVYASPTLTISKAYRADSSGTASDEGTHLALEANYSVYSGGGNAISSWSASCNGVTETAPASGGSALSGSVKFVIAANLSTESSYPATLTLTDTNGGASGLSGGTVTKTVTLGVAAYPLDVWRYEDDGSYGVAIGGLVTRKGFDVFMDAYFRGSVTMSTPLPIASGGTGKTTASDAWTALGGGAIGKKASLAATDIPELPASKITSGTLTVAHGGTGIANFGELQSDDHATVSVATASWTQLASKSLAAGKWLILAGCYAAANSSGNRQFKVTNETSVTSASLPNSVQFPGSSTALYTIVPVYVTPSATTTYRVFGYQSSGSALNMRAFMRCIRLG